MSRKLELTYDKKGKRWKKKHRGRQLYFGPRGVTKGDLDAYEAALAEWVSLRAELEGQDRTSKAIEPIIKDRQKKLDWWKSWGIRQDPRTAPQAIQAIEEEIALLRQGQQPESYIFPRDSTIETAVWSERYRQMSTDDDSLSLSGAVSMFLKHKTKQVPHKITAGRLDLLRCHLGIIQESLGESLPVNAINSDIWQKFNDDLQDSIKGNRFSDVYAANIQATAKQFFNWCYETDRLETLPRNFRSKSLSIKTTTKKVPTFTDDEAKTIISNASEANKLHFLLMLNTGMTRIDVASLKPAEIDFSEGTITRKRTKTKDIDSAPTVCYRLWDETYRLLRIHAKRKGTRALLNADGKPLYVSELKDTGTGNLHRVDNIATAYYRLSRSLGIQKPLKLFRKTAATKVKSLNKGLESLFLGHSPRTMADKHYASQERFPDDVLSWLGDQFGFPTKRP